MKKYEGLVQDEEGDKVSNATITVKDYVGGANSTIYGSNAIGSNVNGFRNESDGTFSFYAKDGYYNIEISKPGLTTKTIPNVHIEQMAEIVSVKGGGAAADDSTDDTAIIQAVITANPGKRIYFGEGTYRTTGVINVTSANTILVGAGTGATQLSMVTSTTADQFKFSPAGAAATDGTKLAQCGIQGMYLYRYTDGTAGAAVHCLQCTEFKLDDVKYLDYPEGIKVVGGTLGNYQNFQGYATDNLTGAPVANSSLLSFTEAALDGGVYQVPYTMTVSNFKIAGTRHIDAQIIVRAQDGLAITNGYVGNGYNANIRLKCQTANMYIGALTVSGVYFDGVVATTSGTVYGLEIPSDGVGSAVVAYVGFDNCDFANYQTAGIFASEGFLLLGINNCRIYNVRGWGANIAGSNTVSHFSFTNNQVYNCANVTASTGGITVSTLADCTITNNQFSNLSTTGSDTAISLNGTNVNGEISGNTFYNCTSKVTNGATWTGKICGVPVSYTPVLDYATVGTLAVTPAASTFGEYVRHENTVTYDFIYNSSAFTLGTATGNLQLSLPLSVKTLSNYGAHCTVMFGGITNANFTSIVARALSNTAVMTFVGSSSGNAPAAVQHSDTPTGGSLVLRGTITYEFAP